MAEAGMSAQTDGAGHWLVLGRLAANLLGIGVVAMAVALHFAESATVTRLAGLAEVLSYGYVSIYILLIAIGLFAVRCILAGTEVLFWREVGQHAASGIATLALTFTLLGISVGIGSIADTPISQESIGDIVSALTEQFSRAFMTTVVGLPTANLLRAVVAVAAARRASRAPLQAQVAA
jgi:hypothetical protein